jgi:hypothetical protein
VADETNRKRPGVELGRREWLEKSGAAVLGLALPSGVAGCGSCIEANRAWNNAVNIDGIDPDHLVMPKSLPELVELVRRAESERAGLRMSGSGHSFSDVAMSQDYLLSPRGLAGAPPLDRTQLRPEHRGDRSLVRVESGMRLRELNPWLFAQGLALQNMGGYDAQTVVGAAITGTHGSSLSYGPIASQIKSMQVVTVGGAVMQAEPANGITDPARFPGYIDTPEGRVAATLSQDDELFNALSVSLGCMGVVYSVVLEVEPRFWLREVRELVTWGDLKKPGGFLDRLLSRQRLAPDQEQEPTYYEIYFNPYPPKAGQPTTSHACILTKRYKLLDEPAGLTPDEKKRGEIGDRFQEIAAKLTNQGALLADYMNAFPELVPNILRDILKSVEDDGGYVARSYDVFNLGPGNTVRAYGIEMGLDLGQTVAATERVFSTAKELREDEIMHNTPPSLRFVKRSPAHLAMMHGRDAMMLEMGMLVCANDSNQLLETYERRFIEEFGARPHWGLDLNVLGSFEQVRALYPTSADRWLAVYRRMNSRGTFNAAFTDRLGISVVP